MLEKEKDEVESTYLFGVRWNGITNCVLVNLRPRSVETQPVLLPCRISFAAWLD